MGAASKYFVKIDLIDVPDITDDDISELDPILLYHRVISHFMVNKIL